MAVNCFIGAIESYKNEKYEEALELFIETFHINDNVLKKNLQVSTMKYECLTCLVIRFASG